MVKPLDYIATARFLADHGGSRRPRQADLRRAIRTAYYAMFHTLCQNCADCVIGTTGAERSQAAWRQTYRAVEYGYAKGQCRDVGVMSRFPKAIEDFGNQFVNLQESRHNADYEPTVMFARTDVNTQIDTAERAIRSFNKVALKDRRAFAVWVLMKSRRQSR